MKDIVIFILGIFGGKLIEDNLPNLLYTNIAAGFEKNIIPPIVLGYIGYLNLLTKITTNKKVHKKYIDTLVVIVAGIIIDKVKTENKINCL